MIFDVIQKIVQAEVNYLKADWWILLIGISIAVIIKVYVGSDSLRNWIKKNEKISILGSIGFGTFTPLCACGTMAVILSMFASYLPWGPIMAFLVSSPLTSPSQFIFQNRFLGFKLAVGVLTFSILLGITAGFLANLLERKTTFFNSQYRLGIKNENNKPNELNQEDMNCSRKNNKSTQTNDRDIEEKTPWFKKIKLIEFTKEFYNLGIK